MAYLPRVIDFELDALKPLRGAYLIEGPKGVGKTATATRRAKTIWDLADAKVRNGITETPKMALQGAGPILIDEWQLVPDIWNEVKRQVDSKGISNTSILLTGSAPINFPNLHSGAGRILSVRMRPMALSERGVIDPSISFRKLLDGHRPTKLKQFKSTPNLYVKEILQSGFPGIRQIKNSIQHQRALQTYIQLIATRDLPEQGFFLRKPHLFDSWLQAFASMIATTASWSKIRTAAETNNDVNLSKLTSQPYIDLLKSLYLIDNLPAWTGSKNFYHTLLQSDKHYLADPALVTSLLKLNERELQSGKNLEILGRLFEALVVQSVKVYCAAVSANLYYMRTKDGRHEVDLIVESQNGARTAIEIKLSEGFDGSVAKNLLWLKENSRKDIDNLIVIYGGTQYFTDKNGVVFVPFNELGF